MIGNVTRGNGHWLGLSLLMAMTACEVVPGDEPNTTADAGAQPDAESDGGAAGAGGHAGSAGQGSGGQGGKTCGDGVKNVGESCDDGNTSWGDGCSAGCWIEAGYQCTGIPSICTDIDECLFSNHAGCDAHATCTNVIGSYTCTCNAGYSGDGITCADIDECSMNACGINATCTNTDGSYLCACLLGFADCDGNPATGCETNIMTTVEHCGACGNACASGAVCSMGLCCSGQLPRACNGVCTDLATDSHNCGMCGQTADDGDPCTDDTCIGGIASHAQSSVGTSCGVGRECDANGVCIGIGDSCMAGSDCLSGFCVDGVCCVSACDQACMTCGLAGNEGFCLPVPLHGDDPNGTPACTKSGVSCNGNGVCKADIGQACATNSDCLSGNCTSSACSVGLAQTGPLTWQWSMDTNPVAVSVHDGCYAFPCRYPSANLESIVARADGSVMGIGTYVDPIFGFPAGWDYCGGTSGTEHVSGPHPFHVDIDSNGDLNTLASIDQITQQEWFTPTFQCGGKCYANESAYGPSLWPVGGDVGYYYERWIQAWDQMSYTHACTFAEFSKRAPPLWNLGTMETSALHPLQMAGDDLGHVWVRNSSTLRKYAPSGQTVFVLPDPFSQLTIPSIPSFPHLVQENPLVIGAQGEIYAGWRTSSAVNLAKASPDATLQWVKTITTSTTTFTYAVDAAGDLLLAFDSTDATNLGATFLPALGPSDLILAKLDPTGQVIWAKRMGGPGLSISLRTLRRTGTHDLAIILSFTGGTLDLGDGVLQSSPVVAKFDAMGTLLWRADLAHLAPSPANWTLSGHPSGAVYVGGSGGDGPTIPTNANDCQNGAQRLTRLLVVKYGP